MLVRGMKSLLPTQRSPACLDRWQRDGCRHLSLSTDLSPGRGGVRRGCFEYVYKMLYGEHCALKLALETKLSPDTLW